MYDINLTTTDRSTCCAPACLKMLLDYYGHGAPLDQLIEECGVGVAGCGASDVLRVGRAHGLDPFAAWSMDAATVLRTDRPAILWWNYNHFVVFAGLNEAGEPVICNPQRGMYPIDAGTFAARYTGVALCVGHPADLMPEDFFGENEPEPDYFDYWQEAISMNYIIIEAQTNNGGTAIVTPAVYSDAIEAEAVFLEKCAYARRSGLEAHSVTLLDEEGKIKARKCFRT